MRVNKKVVLILILLININLIIASFSYDNPNLPKLEADEIKGINLFEVNISLNGSFWTTSSDQTGLTGIKSGGYNLYTSGDIIVDHIWAGDIKIWNDTINEDAMLSMYTHDLSNSFVLTVTDAGATDFYSGEQYQIRSGDNLFQIIHNLYTGTFLNIDVGNTNPEITSKDGTISFVSDDLTTTGSISASLGNFTTLNVSGTIEGASINLIDEETGLQFDGQTMFAFKSDDNLFMGYFPFLNYANIVGSKNTLIGSNEFAWRDMTSAASNTAVGSGALRDLTTGNSNVGIGINSGQQIEDGIGNMLIGSNAGLLLIGGDNNIFIGRNSGQSTATDISYNTVIGDNAGQQLEASYSVLIGKDAGKLVSTGIRQVHIGALAGNSITTGHYNTLIGFSADGFASDTEYAIGLGEYATPKSNEFVISSNINTVDWSAANPDMTIGTGNFTTTGDVFMGSLNVTLNITSSNVFVPQYIFSHTNVNISVLGADTWTNITFDEEDEILKRGILHTFNDNTNHTFKIASSGVYEISYDFNLEDGSVSPSNIDTASRIIYINGTEVLGSVFETDITRLGVETELTHHLLVRFDKDDIILFQFIASDADVELSTHGNFGDHPESASIVLNKVDN